MAFVVYCLTNRVNGKRYVGQTLQLRERLRQHRNGCNRHCRALSAAVLKYGFDAFDVTVLSEHDTREAANLAERKVILELNTLAPNGYNLREGGHERGEFSEESKMKMREAAKIRGVSPQCRDAQKKAVTGRSLSAAHREKIGAIWRGKKRPEYSKLQLARYSDPTVRAAHSARMKTWWAERKQHVRR